MTTLHVCNVPAVIRCIGEDSKQSIAVHSIAVQSIAEHRALEGHGMFLSIKINVFCRKFVGLFLGYYSIYFYLEEKKKSGDRRRRSESEIRDLGGRSEI